MFILQTAAFGTQFKNIQSGRVINEHRRFGKALYALGIELFHFMLFHFTSANLL